MKLFLLILKSLRRNLLRTVLTCLAIMVLVFVVTLIGSMISFLDDITTEKAKDFKAIVTERWQIPSQMPLAYWLPLSEGAADSSRPGDLRPDEYMTWQFYGGTIDPEKQTRENVVFFFAMDPQKLRTMMDDLDMLDPKLADKLDPRKGGLKQGALVGRKRLEKLNKRVGERIKLTGLNYRGIDLEFEIVGLLPSGRYDESAVMNWEYLNDAIDAYKGPGGAKHPLDRKRLNLVWLKVPDSEAFRRIADQIETSSLFRDPAVKCETAASGIASWLDAYRDLIWGMKWLLVPAILATMSLVIANAIGISVRERRTEMAVLKVLGFRPWQILILVLGEALLLGVGSGLLAAVLTVSLVNIGGIKFPIAFFPVFYIPAHALWWGPTIGGLTAFAGSILPAWSARTVKVSEVFAKVA
jgi:putative ABC transport system permease protein